MSPTPSKPPKNPAYRLHRATGQAVVTLNGRDFYLGRHRTAASVRRYDRLISDWLAHGRQLADPAGEAPAMTINMLIARYWKEHVVGWYVKNGRPTTEQANIKQAFRPLKRLYGDTPAATFGPRALETLREEMVKLDWCRKYVNESIHRVKALFRWGVAQELLPAGIYQALQAVRGLAKGRSAARESIPVRPVPQAHIDAVRARVSPQVRAMIDLQLLTGMRPGEVCIMRTCDLTTTGKCWTYRPAEHKTEHHNKAREIYLGPKAQAILQDYLQPDTAAYLFSPIEAEAARHAALARRRKTRVQPSQIRRHERSIARRANGSCKVAPQHHYTTTSYRRAVARACEQAFPLPEPLARRNKETWQQWKARMTPDQQEAAAAWRREHSWHPHQLRHNAATFLRREYGIEAARVVLGHHSSIVTEVYAELDQATAARVMAIVG